jgi:hypothetical protein
VKPLRVAVQDHEVPDPVQDRVRVVLAFLIVSLAVLVLPALLVSPPYAAVTVTFPAVVPVMVAVQLPRAFRVHVVGEEVKVTDPPLVLDWDHNTDPVGTPYPFTVAVHVIVVVDDPAATEVGLQETVVFEDS